MQIDALYRSVTGSDGIGTVMTNCNGSRQYRPSVVAPSITVRSWSRRPAQSPCAAASRSVGGRASKGTGAHRATRGGITPALLPPKPDADLAWPFKQPQLFAHSERPQP